MKFSRTLATAATAAALLVTPAFADGHKGAKEKGEHGMSSEKGERGMSSEKGEHGMKGKENAMERGEGKKEGLKKHMDGDDKTKKMKKEK